MRLSLYKPHYTTYRYYRKVGSLVSAVSEFLFSILVAESRRFWFLMALRKLSSRCSSAILLYNQRSKSRSKYCLGSMGKAILIRWDPANTPLPPHLGSYTRTSELLVSQARRHLCVTPWAHLRNKNSTCGTVRLPNRTILNHQQGLSVGCTLNQMIWTRRPANPLSSFLRQGQAQYNTPLATRGRILGRNPDKRFLFL